MKIKLRNMFFSTVLFCFCFSPTLFSYRGDNLTATDRIALGAAEQGNLLLLFQKSGMCDFHPNACDVSGMTMLHHAVSRNDLPMVAFLVGCGASVEPKDDDFYTPAMDTRDQGIIDFLKNIRDERRKLELFSTERNQILSNQEVDCGVMNKIMDDVARSLYAADHEILRLYEKLNIVDVKEKVSRAFNSAFKERDMAQAVLFWGMGFKIDDEWVKIFLGWVEGVEEKRKAAGELDSVSSDNESDGSYVDSHGPSSDDDDDENKFGLGNRLPSPKVKEPDRMGGMNRKPGLGRRLKRRLFS